MSLFEETKILAKHLFRIFTNLIRLVPYLICQDRLSFFGMHMEQAVDCIVKKFSEDKLQTITSYTLPKSRLNDQDSKLTPVELHSFQSSNGSLIFLGMTISPLCSFISSHLQQIEGHPTFHGMTKKTELLKISKRFGTTSTFKCPKYGSQEPSFLFFFQMPADQMKVVRLHTLEIYSLELYYLQPSFTL